MTVVSEAARLAELRSFDVLDTAPEPGFDALVESAALLTGCAIARVSLLDERRQWFKAGYGSPKKETPREVAFCEHVLRADAALVVPDTRLDVRFAHYASVTAEPGVRFYAGFPLRTGSGAVLGTLCVLDPLPRPEGLTDVEHAVLAVLANQVVVLLELRRALAQREGMLQEAAAAARRYRALADSATDVVSHHLPDGTLLYVSPSVTTTLGYDPDSAVGTCPDRLVHPQDVARLVDARHHALAGSARSLAVRVRHAEGTWRHLDVRLSPVLGDAGAVTELHSVARDVSDRTAADERLRLSEDRYRLLFEANPIGQVELSPEGVVQRANSAFAELVGVPDAALLVGQTPAWATAEGEQPDQQVALRTAAAAPGVVLRTERTLTRPDGTVLEVAGSVVGVPGADGRTVVLIGSAVDITERNASARRAAQLSSELAAARDEAVCRNVLNDTVLDTVGVGIVACDADGRLTLFNRATRDFLDLSADPDADPADWAELYSLRAEDGTTLLAREQVPLYRALTQGSVEDATIVIASQDRPPRTVRCDGRDLRDDDGRLLGAVVVMTDVTESRITARVLAEQAAYTAVLLETAHTAIWSCDVAGRSTYVNRTARGLLGWSVEEPLADLLATGQSDRRRQQVRLLGPDGREVPPDQSPLLRALREGPVPDVELVVDSPGQSLRTLLIHATPLHDVDGVLIGALSTGHDVTDLRASEARFRAAFHDGPTPVARLDQDGVLQEVNPALRRLSGRRTTDLLGTALADHVLEADRARLAVVLDGPGTGSEPVEVRLVRADGLTVWCELATTVSTDANGTTTVLVQLLDVDARKAQELVLELAAQHDPLTGLGNRSLLVARIEAMREPEQQVGLLFLDLDGFKTVNDRYGHDAGDAVLVEVGARLLAGVRPGDAVVRLGGDEFVIVCALPPASPDRVLEALARRVEQAVSQPVSFRGQELPIGGSVGGAVAVPGQTPQSLVEQADRAMYQRKQSRARV